MDQLPPPGQGAAQIISVSLDVVILIDATRSMKESLPEAQTFAVQLLSKMRSRQDLQHSRIGIVAYRDFEEGPPQVLDFVEQSAKAREFMLTVKTIAGGDIPEDVQGGLERALGLSWGPDASVKEGEVKLIVHIADAPAHGPCECAL